MVNIEQAKTIPIPLIMERIGVAPFRQNEREIRYLSPLRQERTASLHVHKVRNVWYDFGEGKGGNGIDLVCAYLQVCGEDATVADALRWLRSTAGNFTPIALSQKACTADEDKGWQLKSVKPIQHLALVRYLDKRGIPLPLAKRHLKEVHVQSLENGKEMFALGFPNEDGGYELRNPFFKSCVAPKTITFIRGAIPKPVEIHLFEGFMDYLSAVASCKQEQLNGDSIVLNSLSCLPEAFPYIKGYGYRILFSWMDNDAPGKKATKALAEFVRTEENLQHKPVNATFTPHKDVNAWHMHALGLST
ncbi:toprim domain-containing protein [Adhaeribacter arboris]|uniref:toprim domain-containing protein n=1 Tax=Adhaeribacter arboris TaxID=2072846 RepID=UPI001E613959|nr:toprim domain-containing protein [Adhaeribacter arboris]